MPAISSERTPVRHARLYRMATDRSICPYGLKSRDLLERHGFELEDHPLRTREKIDAFKREHDVATTPQIFIDGKPVGGYEALREHLGLGREGVARGETSYRPVVTIFIVAFLMALAAGQAAFAEIDAGRTVRWFVAFTMCILAIQKLQDVASFTNMFLGYDLLAQKYPRYAWFYPYGEALAGILMIAGVLLWIAVPVALFIGGIGAASVIKAVYIDKRQLKCACAGGDSSVPLGFVSLTENVAMVGMAMWMLVRAIG